MLDQTGLRDRADDAVGTLSGGNQQRVNIAVGLLGEPRLLLLDEPSSSLDPRQRERLWEFVATLAREDGTTVVYTTHNVAEAERHADRVLVLADGELLFTGTPAELAAGDRRARGARLRGRVRALPAGARPLMRWLLLKDLRILRRSPLLVALLVLYPLLVALLVGAALVVGPVQAEGRVREPRAAGRGADQPRRPAARRDLLRRRSCSRTSTRSGSTRARRRSRRSSPARRSARSSSRPTSSSGCRTGSRSAAASAPTVEVYFSAENPLKRRYVQSTIAATLADANKALSTRSSRRRPATSNLIVAGGTIDLPVLGDVDILGLRNAQTIIDAAARGPPRGDPTRAPLEQVSRFAQLATENLDLSETSSTRSATPVAVEERALGGSRPSLDVFAVEVAVASR